MRLESLHHDSATLRQCSTSPNGLIGAFHRFDRHDHAILHDNALPDIQFADGLGHLPTERNVPPFGLRGRSARQHSLFYQQALQPEGRFPDSDPFIFQFRGNSPQNHVILADSQAAHEGERAKVRADVRKQMCLLDTANHDSLAHPVPLESFDQFTELAEGDPLNPVNALLQRRFCLAG